MMPLSHEVVIYGGVSYAHKAYIDKLRKDAGDDGEDDSDEETDDDITNDGGSAGSDNTDVHPRLARIATLTANIHAGQPVHPMVREVSSHRKTVAYLQVVLQLLLLLIVFWQITFAVLSKGG